MSMIWRIGFLLLKLASFSFVLIMQINFVLCDIFSVFLYCMLIISAHLLIPVLFTHCSENSSELGNWFTQESPAPSQRKQNLLLGLGVSSALPLRFGFCLDLFCSLLLCSYLSPSLDHRSAHEWVHLLLSVKCTGKKNHHGFTFTNASPINTCISG